MNSTESAGAAVEPEPEPGHCLDGLLGQAHELQLDVFVSLDKLRVRLARVLKQVWARPARNGSGLRFLRTWLFPGSLVRDGWVSSPLRPRSVRAYHARNRSGQENSYIN